MTYSDIALEQGFATDNPTVMKSAFLLRWQISRQLNGLQLKTAFHRHYVTIVCLFEQFSYLDSMHINFPSDDGKIIDIVKTTLNYAILC